MKTLILLAFVFLTTHIFSQINTWNWNVSNKTADIIDQYTDAVGNTYVTGTLFGTVVLGTTTLTSAGQADVYIAKYDISGNFLWAKRGGGTNDDQGFSISADGLGNSYITGYIRSTTAAFGTNTLSCAGAMDVFVCKYGPNGNELWAKRFGGGFSNYEQGYGIVADATGNTYITGSFYGNFSVPPIPFISSCGSGQNTFIMSLDPVGNGLWVRRTTCTNPSAGNYSYGTNIALDGQGNVIMGSLFNSDTCRYEGIKLTNSTIGSTDGVIAKYTSTGTFKWLRQLSSFNYNDIYGIAPDSKGNIFVAGNYQGTLSFPTFSLLTGGTAGTYNTYVMKVDSTGMPVWGNRIGNTSYQHPATDIVVSADSILYISGYFQDHLWFDNSIILPNQGSSLAYGMFIAKYQTASGVVSWEYDSRDAAPRIVKALSIDGYHNLYVGGSFNNTLTLGATPAITSGTAAANFLARYGDITTSIIEGSANKSVINIYPNPNNGSFTIDLTYKSQITITNVLGEIVFDQSQETGKQNLNIQSQTAGVYYVKVADAKGVSVTKKVVKQ